MAGGAAQLLAGHDLQQRSFQRWTTRWWFQRFFIFTPIWGRFPIWLIFFTWVETTNQTKMLMTWFFWRPDPCVYFCSPKGWCHVVQNMLHRNWPWLLCRKEMDYDNCIDKGNCTYHCSVVLLGNDSNQDSRKSPLSKWYECIYSIILYHNRYTSYIIYPAAYLHNSVEVYIASNDTSFHRTFCSCPFGDRAEFCKLANFPTTIPRPWILPRRSWKWMIRCSAWNEENKLGFLRSELLLGRQPEPLKSMTVHLICAWCSWVGVWKFFFVAWKHGLPF